MYETDGIEEISFDWMSVDELEPTLHTLRLPQIPHAAILDRHYRPLRQLADHLNVGTVGKDNALNLARGHSDLAIILLEPANTENVLAHGEQGGLPQTIAYLDAWLKRASRGRNWKNTCILDIKPFHIGEDTAFDAVEEALESLQPSVVLLCQTGTSRENHPFARCMSSSVGKAGRHFLHRFQSGKTAILIGSFHPMYAIRSSDPLVGRVRQAMTEFTILQAINILAGRIIIGPGISKLYDAVWGAKHDTPRLRPNGQLDKALDDRFRGVFLHPRATPAIKKMWETVMQERRAIESEKYHGFISVILTLKSQGNVTRLDEAFSSLQGLREALPK
ncbi:hypothetical protein LTR10_023999 [Elasticomyces elasticus]|uniref:Uncharacterized protein n=1 Tax=Exophiala sideris TaxID=1016849 RepID=A0ABR0IV53_9EURO|nr:hypothetical protein LTR10_023999 [Elasticomyces elasticus]KAK5020967.1 hypothetical protein LTS07_011324 [Exophiala sideris]KAK5028110.1 hypothetical protein LTR13_009339 [Exophiala sideris]KAK5048459.1 hypothetical protein LTR69_011349 [Exophiala sideris]